MAEAEWTGDTVADHFEEAFRTLRKLPPVKAQGYFNTWPDIVRTSREIAAMEPQPMRVWPSAAAITTRPRSAATARSHTRTAIGRPVMSASGLPGSRVEAMRQGMTINGRIGLGESSSLKGSGAASSRLRP